MEDHELPEDLLNFMTIDNSNNNKVNGHLAYLPRPKTFKMNRIDNKDIINNDNYEIISNTTKMTDISKQPYKNITIDQNTIDLIKYHILSTKRELNCLLLKDYEEYKEQSKEIYYNKINELKLKLNDLYKIYKDLIQIKQLRASSNKRKAKLPFDSSEERFYDKPIKPIERPHFYQGPIESNFGFDKREQTIDMNAFGYIDKFKLGLVEETIARKDCLVEIKRPKSRCRDTNFYDLVTQSIVKSRGSNSSEKLPSIRPMTSSAQSFRSTGTITTLFTNPGRVSSRNTNKSI